ncbi:MAG: hypothetical protein WBB65_00815 [Anaerolineales bacterium]
MKFLTVGIAVSLMGFNMARMGVAQQRRRVNYFHRRVSDQPGVGDNVAYEYQRLREFGLFEAF